MATKAETVKSETVDQVADPAVDNTFNYKGESMPDKETFLFDDIEIPEPFPIDEADLLKTFTIPGFDLEDPGGRGMDCSCCGNPSHERADSAENKHPAKQPGNPPPGLNAEAE